MHRGIGGLAYTLEEIRLTRPWTTSENELAAAIGERLRAAIPTTTDTTFFDGLVSSIGVLTALGQPGTSAILARLETIATGNGWPESFLDEPRYAPGAVANDVTLGTGAILLGSLWAMRHGPETSRPGSELANRAVDLLLGEREELPTGVNWEFVSRRFRSDEATAMPNFSHGLAGIVAALAVAGVDLGRPELIEVARRGAEHLVTLGITDDRGFRVPRVIPWAKRHGDEYTFNWCHGGAGTALTFSALEYADVPQIAGETPRTWHSRCLDGVRYSGIPERLHPGFWDNDGRCCGTAGVGDTFLDAWQHNGAEQDLEFAVLMGDTLVDHAYPEGYWRFLEHTAPDPLLPPGPGWMQGAAGIAAFLLRLERALAGDQRPVARMDNWWALT
ncbi:lanthionine synthetase LanC family protein [Kribbella sp. NPDC048928]|uniref:lanthionine synthetase LanC family protein n=1 Tax=Kribbella sp. NPDC048928 TaxID=3364111 RepID=UPI003713D3B8